ncbi:hypothetical protein Tco_0903930, partial [Tanacetum coccineum]
MATARRCGTISAAR